MHTEEILKYYWDIFLSHTCEFYPLDKAFIKQYEYELDWTSISKNKRISWDLDFLEQYETRFKWHELAWNEAILWDEEKIDRFKKRLDWYYLGRNKNLPITDEFIIKFAKNLFVIENNPRLTDELIEKYDLKILPEDLLDTQEIKSYHEDDFDKVFNKYHFIHNQQVIYEQVFLPIIEESSLQKIFEQTFDYSQRYYYLGPVQHDIYGLTTCFEIYDINPFSDFREGLQPFEIPQKLVLKNGSLQEGPDRLYEVPRLSSMSYYTILLISENVKQVLEQFKLPNHLFHEVKLIPKKIKTATKFYILQMDFDTLSRDLVFEGNSFHYSFREFKVRGGGKVEATINNHNEREAVKQEITKRIQKSHGRLWHNVKLYPERFILNSDYDLYSHSVHKEIIINQFLKDALEKNFPNQIEFKSAQLLNISIDQPVYDAKKSLSINTKLSSRVTYKQSDEDKFYFAKAERLAQSDPAVDVSQLTTDKFSKQEFKLNVVFPALFKNNYLNKRLKIKGYTLLPISKFYVNCEYADRYPETYKAVAIAENGIGDSINLMLEKDSDYKLQNRLFEFFHETGEYEEI